MLNGLLFSGLEGRRRRSPGAGASLKVKYAPKLMRTSSCTKEELMHMVLLLFHPFRYVVFWNFRIEQISVTIH
jgi:hypothetical protein